MATPSSRAITSASGGASKNEPKSREPLATAVQRQSAEGLERDDEHESADDWVTQHECRRWPRRESAMRSHHASSPYPCLSRGGIVAAAQAP